MKFFRLLMFCCCWVVTVFMSLSACVAYILANEGNYPLYIQGIFLLMYVFIFWIGSFVYAVYYKVKNKESEQNNIMVFNEAGTFPRTGKSKATILLARAYHNSEIVKLETYLKFHKKKLKEIKGD